MYFRLPDRAIRLGLKPLVFALGVAPAASLAWAALAHQFNANPFNAIVRSTGFWSLRFLCLTIAVTPFRWITGWHAAVKFRRMLGLFAFFYGTLHLAAYVAFDRVAALDALDRGETLAAAARVTWAIGLDLWRPFFATGMVGFALMMPLAATSTVGMIGRLGGRRWQALHRLVYPAAIASVIHTYWPLTARMQTYSVVVAVVLALRLVRARRGG